MRITGGMLLQSCAIVVILIACWFLESGAIIVWWCEVSCAPFSPQDKLANP
jgi:hypothetical protein